jgi:hypothetical protein
MKCSDSLSAVTPASLSFAGRLPVSRASVFVSPVEPMPLGGQELWQRQLPGRLLSRGSSRASQVPGEPWCAYAVFSDPGGTGATRPAIRWSGTVPDVAKPRTTRGCAISGLNSTASALAVYASWYGLRRRCTQDSLPAAGQALLGGIVYPQGSYERFQRCNRYIHPPFPSFAWRSATLPSLQNWWQGTSYH